MALNSNTDGIFVSLPPIVVENDYDRFWERATSELKRISIDAEIKTVKGSSRFDAYEMSFRSAQKYRLTGTLHIPKAIEKPHPVIVIHDYNHPDPYKGFYLDDGLAYFFLKLRGHEHIKEFSPEQPPSEGKKTVKKHPQDFPGYLQENIVDAHGFYVRQVCLDALRTIDALRLNRKIDCGTVGIIGKGLGALAGLFAATQSNRVSSIVLDSPLFAWIQQSQNESGSDSAREINEYIRANSSKAATVKKNLSYFDALPFASKFGGHVMMSIGMRDGIAPPECSMALFNHFLCEKEMQIYPDDGNESGGEKQFRKASSWLVAELNR
jgi:cephalosporin-C deacetylase-like acetyl esterase